ncbi:hypothetical protein GC56T3_0507 [Geobacillus sp. C56-T3]|nr:hypothetical protein GC56T3_0507 [Geobacillus sp. C56-T3]ADU95461.1 hypothetical protein GYMC52_3101 [Geobacillus sp. Y412MC52]
MKQVGRGALGFRIVLTFAAFVSFKRSGFLETKKETEAKCSRY